MDPTIKAAKKILKKDESSSMALKALVKAVVEKLGDKLKSSQVKELLRSSDKFLIEGKNVSLSKSSKKRKSGSEGGGDVAEKKSAKKAKKEAKKRNAESGVTTKALDPSSSNDSTEWRSKNKVVLKDTLDGEEGAKATIELNNNKAYLPCTTFESKTLKESIDNVLLKQCTEVNGFTTPSAIQAQCWPILLQKGSDGKRRDIVG